MSVDRLKTRMAEFGLSILLLTSFVTGSAAQGICAPDTPARAGGGFRIAAWYFVDHSSAFWQLVLEEDGLASVRTSKGEERFRVGPAVVKEVRSLVTSEGFWSLAPQHGRPWQLSFHRIDVCEGNRVHSVTLDDAPTDEPVSGEQLRFLRVWVKLRSLFVSEVAADAAPEEAVLRAAAALSKAAEKEQTGVIVFLDPLVIPPMDDHTRTRNDLAFRVATRLKDILSDHGIVAMLSRDSDRGKVPPDEERRWLAIRADADVYVGLSAAVGNGDCVWLYQPPAPDQDGREGLSLGEFVNRAIRESRIEQSRHVALGVVEELKKNWPAGCVELRSVSLDPGLEQAMPAVLVEFRLATTSPTSPPEGAVTKTLTAIASVISRGQKLPLPELKRQPVSPTSSPRASPRRE